MGVRRGEWTFTPLEIGTTRQIYLENLKSEAWFQIVGLILAMAVYLVVWHSHCTRARFTVLVSCSGEFAVHSCPLFFCSGRLQNWQEYCFIVGLYCVTITWQQIFKGPIEIMVKAFYRMWLLNADILPIAELHVILYCVKKKHGCICSDASTSLKNSLLVWDSLVWDCKCEHCSWTEWIA